MMHGPGTGLLWNIAQGRATAEAHARLRAILGRGEFVHVHEPGLLSVLWSHLLRWLWRSFGRAAGVGGRSEWVGRAFWGLVIAAGMGALLWWLRRQGRRQGLPARAPAPAAAVAAREWEQWRTEALRLAEAGQWRDAIHALYWAAVSRLEAQGRWSRDRARTPREYLLLMPEGSAARREFALLTRSFEQFWYGPRVAQAQDFEAARSWFSSLEAR